MRYFIIKQDPLCTDSPHIINWSNKIDVRNIIRGKSHKLPLRTLLEIQPSENTIFTDIVSTPFFIHSDLVKEAVMIYEPKMPYKQIVLLDDQNLFTKLYHLPILASCDCLSPQSELNLDASVIKKAILERAKLPRHGIFKIDKVSSTYVIVRLDLAESLLRRGVRGISLTEVEVV